MDEKVVKDLIDRLIDLSFAEDIGDGDHTTLSCIPADAMGKSKLLIKEEGILAGIEVAKEVFRRFDPGMKVTVYINDGAHVSLSAPVQYGEKVGEVRASLDGEEIFYSDIVTTGEVGELNFFSSLLIIIRRFFSM